MLANNIDYVCSSAHNIYYCVGKTPAGVAHIRRLLELVRATIQQAATVRKVPQEMLRIPVADRIGPIAALATQMVLGVMNHSVALPDSLKPILSIQQNELEIIRRVTESSDLISNYIVNTLTLFPKAPFALETTLGAEEPPKKRLSWKSVAAGVGGLGVLGGLVFYGRKTYRRVRGMEDQSHLLPGGDDDDDYEYSDDYEEE